MKRTPFKNIVIFCLVLTFSILSIFIIDFFSKERGRPNLFVQLWRPIVVDELKHYNREDLTDTILAIMQQESSGIHQDLMQSSESAGLEIGTLKGKDSIKQGIKYFIECYSLADEDVSLALQSYNFGKGYIYYVQENGGIHSYKLASQFANIQAKQLNWQRYGDPLYVDHVMKYLQHSPMLLTDRR